MTEKGKSANAIQLEPNPQPEIIWYNSDRLISLSTGKYGALLPDKDFLNTEFVYCNIFPIISGCEDAREEAFIARVKQSFKIGSEKATEKIHEDARKELARNLLEVVREPSQDLSLNPVSWLSDRLEQLRYSLNFSIEAEAESLSLILEEYKDELSLEVAERLETYLPGLLQRVWEREAKKLPLAFSESHKFFLRSQIPAWRKLI